MILTQSMLIALDQKNISIHASCRLLSFFQIITWTLAVNIFYIFPTCILNTAVLKLRAYFITGEQLGMVRNARYVGVSQPEFRLWPFTYQLRSFKPKHLK